MRVRVLFFGVLKELAGKSDDALDLADGSSVRDLLEYYGAHSRELTRAFPSVALAVNQQYVGADTKLKSGDEVAILPPVSGGSGSSTGEGRSSTARRRALQPEGPSDSGAGHVAIIRETIDTHRVLSAIKRGEDGATVTFEGIVRNQTRGRRTLYLSYEAYEEMALHQLQKLAGQALKQFQVRDVSIVHRLGQLEIGETSVLIVVASAHRGTAFDACRWLIDSLKRTVPIWKKEFFEDGAVWADGEPFPAEIPRASGSPGTDGASK